MIRVRRPKPQYPLEQLKIVHAELDRQRDATLSRQGTLQQRAGILLGAAGLTVGFVASRVPGMFLDDGTFEPSALLTWPAVWAEAGGLTSLTASILALLCLLPSKGPEVTPSALFQNALRGDPYSVEYQLVQDKIAAHAGDVRATGRRLNVLVGCTWCLVAAWAALVVHLLLDARGAA